MTRRAAWLWVGLALCCRPVWAGAFQDDLKARRARVMERLGPEAMLTLWSAPVRTYSRDIDYEYRQDSDFYYLTGIEQEGSILVLMPGNATRKAVLFIQKVDPQREHWRGRMLSQWDGKNQSGIGTVYWTSQFDAFVGSMLSKTPFDVPPHAASEEYEAFFQALRDNEARFAVLRGSSGNLSEPLPAPMEFANKMKQRFPGFSIEDATEILYALRQVKTPYEQTILERAAQIASEGQKAGMRAARPGAFEYEVEAAIEATYLRLGARGPSYPPIVGSGPNANHLHYSQSSRRMDSGDLLLVDAAANYNYMTADITRTYPVDGAFSPQQKDIYRVVLAAQDAGVQAARAGVTLDAIHLKTVEAMKKGLLELGLITDPSGDQYRLWYTHGACHWIGIDVHDVGMRQRPLKPGMAFVIEPGLYIREGALENLPDTPEDKKLVEKVRPAFEEYKGIGVRIEDSFLVTETGVKCLSADVPRTIEDVERFLASRSTISLSR